MMCVWPSVYSRPNLGHGDVELLYVGEVQFVGSVNTHTVKIEDSDIYYTHHTI